MLERKNMKKIKKSQKKYLRKKLDDKNSIVINGKRSYLPKEIDEKDGTIKKQIFDKNYQVKQRNKHKYKGKSPCIGCDKNKSGYCEKYNQWCNLCENNCLPEKKRSYNVYVYRDKNHKKHILKY